jgi:hypothetical protein
MICIDQTTGEKQPRILTALRDYRNGKVRRCSTRTCATLQMHFGVYLQVDNYDKNATIECNETIQITRMS